MNKESLKPLSDQIWSEEEPVLVSVFVATYNHAKFIEDALKGFLKQETNFRVEVLINEDCSTDNTAEILKRYEKEHPDLFKIIYQTVNQYSQGIKPFFHILPKIAKGKYIAICEGDDYWTDPLKLQKQVDFLENNPSYSISWTKYKVFKNNKHRFPDWENHLNLTSDYIINLDNVFIPYCTLTLTCVFRASDFDVKLCKSLKHSKDNSLYAICLSRNAGVLLNFYSSVYRVHDGGVYSNVDEFEKVYKSYLNIKEIINKVPNCNNENINKTKKFLLMMSLKNLRFFKNIKTSYLIITDSIKLFGLVKVVNGVLFSK